MASLEGRIREHEQRCIEANLKMQQRAQYLKVENDKLKTILTLSFGIDGTKTEEQNSGTILQEIRGKFAVNELAGQPQVPAKYANHTPLSGAIQPSCTYLDLSVY